MKSRSLIFSILFCLTLSKFVYSSPVILNDFQGQKIPFATLQGKWVLINYWASWCQPCLDEIKDLNYFYKLNKDRVALFAVNFDGLPLKNQLKLIRKYKISYPSLRTDPARALRLGDIQGVPATFVFKPNGKLHRVLYGAQSLESLKRAIS